eukprot:5768988-Amphidinium_carterae.1
MSVRSVSIYGFRGPTAAHLAMPHLMKFLPTAAGKAENMSEPSQVRGMSEASQWPGKTKDGEKWRSSSHAWPFWLKTCCIHRLIPGCGQSTDTASSSLWPPKKIEVLECKEECEEVCQQVRVLAQAPELSEDTGQRSEVLRCSPKRSPTSSAAAVGEGRQKRQEEMLDDGAWA